MTSSGARALLLLLFKSSNQRATSTIPSVLSSFGHCQNYKSTDPKDDQHWTDAVVCEVKGEQDLNDLDAQRIQKAVEAEFHGENIFIGPMTYSIDCVKDTSNNPDTDIFFAIAFSLKERLDQFPDDWFKATPYMASCNGFKHATVYKVLGDQPMYPFVNIAIWASLESWKQAIATEESKEAHAHQNHVGRTPFIGQLFQGTSK